MIRPRCSTCGRPAADIEVTEEAGVSRLRYSGPGGSNGSGDVIPAERAKMIRAAFVLPYEAAWIKAAGFYDDAGFCADCGKFYCATHWNISSKGAGRCPEGHYKKLDPHGSPD